MLNKFSPLVSGAFIGKSVNRVLSLLPADSKEFSDFQRSLMSTVRSILGVNKPLSTKDIELVKTLLKKMPVIHQDEMLNLLYTVEPMGNEEVVKSFSQLPRSEQKQVMSCLVALAIRSDNEERSKALLIELLRALDFSDEEILEIYEEQQRLNLQRNRILRSGAGIIVALIVVVVFIITATLLRAVVFGLILAFVMLPLEKFFERKLAKPNSVISLIFAFFSKLTSPMRKFTLILKQRTFSVVVPEESDEEKRKTRINRAVVSTTLSLTIIVLAVMLWAGIFSFRYVNELKDSHNRKQSEVVVANSKPAATSPNQEQDIETQALNSMEGIMAPIFKIIDKLNSEFDQSPIIKSALNEIASSLHSEKTKQAMLNMFLKGSGGVFSFTTGLLSSLSALVMDLLLAIFFFLLFLAKLAEFCSGENSHGRQGEYLVRSIFNGNWLPGASETTIAEAERIISEIINKLKIWMRGYFWLILLDMSVYSVAFFFLEVPYFFLLGALAGCGILLPYIGPILSAVVTLGVTLAVGGTDTSIAQLIGILAAYLIYNGIIEQFIVYPLVIGESLGLTTLETIIVVLLGAIFAGIPGMILAIPTASVLKYLVPQIYNCFEYRKKAITEEQKNDFKS